MQLANQDKEKFWSKVNKDGSPEYPECWLWTASTNEKGYGKFFLRGKRYRAHVVAYEMVNGVIPYGHEASHTCHNRRCVNPSHLKAETHAQNMQRSQAVGRMTGARGKRNGKYTHPERTPRGERHGSRTHPERLARGGRNGAHTHPERMPSGETHYNAKITDAHVLEIRRLRGQGVLLRVLSAKFNTTVTNISSIANGKSRRVVSEQ